MMNRFIAYNMPKIELHCHLDGSMSVELTQKLLADMGEEYTKEELQEALTAPMDCPSLADYLKRFDLPLRCLQTKEGLRAAVTDAVKGGFRLERKLQHIQTVADATGDFYRLRDRAAPAEIQIGKIHGKGKGQRTAGGVDDGSNAESHSTPRNDTGIIIVGKSPLVKHFLRFPCQNSADPLK